MKNDKMELWRVDTGYAVAGLLVENGIVRQAAPILRRRCRGRLLSAVRASNRGWVFERLDTDEEAF